MKKKGNRSISDLVAAGFTEAELYGPRPLSACLAPDDEVTEIGDREFWVTSAGGKLWRWWHSGVAWACCRADHRTQCSDCDRPAPPAAGPVEIVGRGPDASQPGTPEDDYLPHMRGGTLVIPTGCPTRYRWWDDRGPDRLTMCQILAELKALPAVHRAYCGDRCRWLTDVAQAAPVTVGSDAEPEAQASAGAPSPKGQDTRV